MTRNLDGLTHIDIKPNADKSRFRFHLVFDGATQPAEPIEFEMAPDGMMTLMVGLQKLQEFHKLPIPEAVRPKGKPSLSIVTDE
jgi:hypothetical protein